MEVQHAIKKLNAGNVPGAKARDGLQMEVLKAVLRRQLSAPKRQHARVVSILKPGKDPAKTSSCILIRVHDNVGKLFEKFLLTRVLQEVKARGLLVDEQFGLRQDSLMLVRLAETVNGNSDENWLIGTVLPDVTKALDTALVKGLLYKLSEPPPPF